MNFNLPVFLFTVGCCLISMFIAGAGANKKGKEWLDGLKHPDNSFLIKIMNILGFVFYGSFGYVLYHLCVSGDIAAIVLTVAAIQINGIIALILYKFKNFKLFFAVSILLPVVLIILTIYLIQVSLTLVIIPALYLLWLVYDFNYYYRLMKLNS